MVNVCRNRQTPNAKCFDLEKFVYIEMLSDTDCEAEKPSSHKRDLMFTPVEVYIEHPLLLVVLLMYGDNMLYGGAL